MKTLITLILAIFTISSTAQQQSKKKNSIEQQFAGTKWKCISDDLKQIKFDTLVDSYKLRYTIHPSNKMVVGTIEKSYYTKKFGHEDIKFNFCCSFYDKDSIFIDGITIEDQLIFRGKYTFLTNDIVVFEGYEVSDKNISYIYDVKVSRKNFTLIREKN